MVERFDLVVIGGGISGLSLAHFCARAGLRVAVLEKERMAGGAVRTERTRDGFWVEMGAHTCYNSYGRLLGMLEELGLLGSLKRREKAPWVFREEGRIRPVTKKVHWPELLGALPRLLFTAKEGRSVEDYYARVLGRRNFAQVARPMLDAVACQDVRDFPAGMLFKSRPRRKELPRSFTLETGLQAIVEGIAAGGGFAVRTGQAVAKVSHARGRFRIEATGGRSYESRALALAAAPSVGARLLKAAFPAVAAPLAGIGERELFTVAVVVEAARLDLPRVAGIVPLNDALYSVVTRDVVPHPGYRGFAFHFRPGGDARLREQRIAEILGVAKAGWKFHRGRAWRLPAPVVGHAQVVAEIDRRTAGLPLAVTGNYFGGLAMEDCVARSAAEAERLVELL